MPKMQPLLEVKPDSSFFPKTEEEKAAYKEYLELGNVGPLNNAGLIVRVETIYLNHEVHCIKRINTEELEVALFTKHG